MPVWPKFIVLIVSLFLAGLPAMSAIAPARAQDNQPTYRVTFVAKLTLDSTPVEDGLEWRIFGPSSGEDGSLPLLAEATGGIRSFDMTAGEYLVHAAYGHASAIRKIEVTPQSTEEYFILNAGGLMLDAVSGENTPIPDNLLRFDIYEDKADERGERRLIASRVLPGRIIPFQEGTYHVVSQYGSLNAEVRADIRVSPGKLTTAELQHRAARITLRLVRTAGGDALADTQWSVLNASGDLITESTSAFPRMVLLEGVYTAIAKNGDRIYSQDFEVRPGLNQDVEVLTGS